MTLLQPVMDFFDNSDSDEEVLFYLMEVLTEDHKVIKTEDIIQTSRSNNRVIQENESCGWL